MEDDGMKRIALVLLALARIGSARAEQQVELLNVSYDPTRELWRQLNEAYARHTPVSIKQSHGGSSAQARAVIDRLDGDVVTPEMPPDTDAIRNAGLIIRE